MEKPKVKMTNAEYVKSNKVFISACHKAGIPVTTRQASKYRNGRGLAYKTQ